MANNLTQSDFTRLFAELEQPLYSFIFSLLPHRADVDDVAQQTVGLLREHFDKYDPELPFLPWAMKFTYNQVLKHRRETRTRRKYFHESLVVELVADHPQESRWNEAHQHAVTHCLGRMHEKDRQVLVTRYFGDGTLDALADRALGVEDVSNAVTSGAGTYGDGTAGSTQAGIWNSGGTLLGSVTVPGGSAAVIIDGFRYVQLSSPVTLSTANTYTIGAQKGGGVDWFSDGYPAANYTAGAGVSGLASR